jgi:hypothetical protein
MSVEGRADIKDLRLEVYFNRNQARRQTFGMVNSLARRKNDWAGLLRDRLIWQFPLVGKISLALGLGLQNTCSTRRRKCD